MKKLILDTDMGPDCDDAGALALLHLLCRETGAQLLAVTHCTSSPYGPGCIDALNRAFGKPDIPVGTLKKRGFLDEEPYRRYNRALAAEFPNRFGEKGESAEDALALMKRTLAAEKDGSVTLVAIGPLTNLAALLEEPEGRALMHRKVGELVCMAGCFTADEQEVLLTEWNLLMDLPAAKTVFEGWRGPMVLAPFELGADIITGKSWHGLSEAHPLRRAYALHSPGGRSSWDLTAVWYALCGEKPFFELSPRGDISLDGEGRTRFSPCAGGARRYLKKAEPAAGIAAALDAYWGRAGEDPR